MDLRTPIAIFGFLALNSALNISNRWALGISGFNCPLILTCAHQAFGFITLLPFVARQGLEVHKANVLPQWKGLVVIGASMALNVSCMNASLQTLSLSLNQVIRSALPVLTSMLSFFVEGKRPTHYELVALSVLSAGVGVAVAGGTLAGSTRGILLCSAATLFQSLMITFSGRVLSKKMDTFKLVFYQAPVALACLLPVALAMELFKFRQHLELQPYTVSLILGATSILALAYNSMHAWVIKLTSAVTGTVVGQVKVVILMALSATVMGEAKGFNVHMISGTAVAMVGFTMYTHCRVLFIQQQQGSSAPGATVAELARGDLGEKDPEKAPLMLEKGSTVAAVPNSSR